MGSYLDSCDGCDVDVERAGVVLRCTHCATGSFGRRAESAIDPRSCADGEWVGNRGGKLVCEATPGLVDAPPPDPYDDVKLDAGAVDDEAEPESAADEGETREDEPDPYADEEEGESYAGEEEGEADPYADEEERESYADEEEAEYDPYADEEPDPYADEAYEEPPTDDDDPYDDEEGRRNDAQYEEGLASIPAEFRSGEF